MVHRTVLVKQQQQESDEVVEILAVEVVVREPELIGELVLEPQLV